MGNSRPRLHGVRVAFVLTIIASLLSLTAPSASAAWAKLAWTSPGAEGGLVRVFYYDLRVSRSPISGNDTLSWWNAAVPVPMVGKVPSLPGYPDSVIVNGLLNGTRYYAILRSADAMLNWSAFSNMATFTSGIITGVSEDSNAPSVVIGTPRPTPTSGRAEVRLALPSAMAVEAQVYDAQGRLVRRLESERLAAGAHTLRWDGSVDGGGDAASGVYWIRVRAGGVDKRLKLVVVR
jgi:flagellar hook capping protein FlgD